MEVSELLVELRTGNLSGELEGSQAGVHLAAREQGRCGEGPAGCPELACWDGLWSGLADLVLAGQVGRPRGRADGN